jgi:NAD(P)-dependent dehydrogenase (short-subunit alcohol dehydrogenase family)
VIVTGATGALGQAVVPCLLSLGARVAVAYRDVDGWRALRRANGEQEALVGIEAELTTPGGAEALVERAVGAFGRLDGLALLAGGWAGGRPFEQAPADEWDRMLRQNLDTAARVCRAALPRLIETRGSAVLVGSRAAAEGGAGMAAYAVAKAAVHALVRVLAAENLERGVRFNAVLPGTIDTAANRRAMPQADRSRWTAPGAIATQVGFLLSPDSRPLSGALLPL